MRKLFVYVTAAAALLAAACNSFELRPQAPNPSTATLER
jgi:hypothetical protein